MMTDHQQKELADSLDKSAQIDKLHGQIEELQRQLAEQQAVIDRKNAALSCAVYEGLDEYWMKLCVSDYEMLRQVLAIPTDRTALDELIKRAKQEQRDEDDKLLVACFRKSLKEQDTSIEPVAWIDEFGNCEFVLAPWMKDEADKGVNWKPVIFKSDHDELQRQFAELQDSFKARQVRKMREEYERKLAEREAVIEKKDAALKAVLESGVWVRGSYVLHRKIYDIACDAIEIPTDHTALDEAIKQTKVETLDKAANWFENRETGANPEKTLRRMADEIRSKT